LSEERTHPGDSSMAETGEMSKSAKKRAAKKAKEAEAAEAAAPPAPPPAPEPKSKAKAKAKPEAKAQAAPKAEPKAQPKAEPKADPKAKAKGKAEPKAPPAEPKAKAEAKAAPEPKAAAGKQKAKAGAKGSAKAAAKPKGEEEEEEKPKKAVEELINYVIDDGTGGEWSTSTGLSTKQQKRKEKKDEEERYLKEMQAAAGGKPLPKNAVPGMAPLDPKQAAQDKKAASQAVKADVDRILAKKNEEEIAAAANVAVANITVPEKKIGIVIGPGGATIKQIQEKTGVTRIDTAGGIFTISGKGPNVEQARDAIDQLIQKGFCSILYEDFSENYVNVHPSHFPDIIGKGGKIIQEIKKQLKVEVSIPPTPDDAIKQSKKYKVTLAGCAKQVEEAKEVLNSIIMYTHHELTHPGIVHEEMEIDNWSLKYIIGKNGSEMKHIQKNWDVKVSIPRDNSTNQKVLIVGEPSNVERAKAYVERVLWNAENQVRGGRDKVDDGDGWGDEEDDIEPWMKDYIYKRT